jgi:hypothetical protein
MAAKYGLRTMSAKARLFISHYPNNNFTNFTFS